MDKSHCYRFHTLRIERVAGDLHGKSEPRLAAGALHQRNSTNDAVGFWRCVDQAAAEGDVIKLRNGGELGGPAVDRCRELPVDWRVR